MFPPRSRDNRIGTLRGLSEYSILTVAETDAFALLSLIIFVVVYHASSHSVFLICLLIVHRVLSETRIPSYESTLLFVTRKE
jgi:hypothetical protein